MLRRVPGENLEEQGPHSVALEIVSNDERDVGVAWALETDIARHTDQPIPDQRD